MQFSSPFCAIPAPVLISARERRTLQPIILYAALLWPYLVFQKFHEGSSIAIYESNAANNSIISRSENSSISHEPILYIKA